MMLRELLLNAAPRLRSAGIESAMLDARLLLQQALGCDHEYIIRHADLPISSDLESAFEALLQRRMAREPLSHITGTRAFWKDEFIVTSNVLDPRPDSETLIETLIRLRPNRVIPYHIADFGVGSGCLILSALREFPHSRATAIDCCERALQVAKHNAQRLHLSDRIDFLLNHWGNALQTPFDMIMSNPPYIVEDEIPSLAPEVREFEPFGALSGGADGLQAYRELLPHIERLLKPDGIAVLEIGAEQREAVCDIACKSGLNVVEVVPDLSGLPRVVVLTQ